MAHEKADVVRSTRLAGWLAPFKMRGDSFLTPTIDTHSAFSNAVNTFASRIADCTTDVSVSVQQAAVSFLFTLFLKASLTMGKTAALESNESHFVGLKGDTDSSCAC